MPNYGMPRCRAIGASFSFGLSKICCFQDLHRTDNTLEAFFRIALALIGIGMELFDELRIAFAHICFCRRIIEAEIIERFLLQFG